MWAHSMQGHLEKVLYHQKLSELPLWAKSGYWHQGRRSRLLHLSSTVSAIHRQCISAAYLGGILHDMAPKTEFSFHKMIAFQKLLQATHFPYM